MGTAFDWLEWKDHHPDAGPRRTARDGRGGGESHWLRRRRRGKTGETRGGARSMKQTGWTAVWGLIGFETWELSQ